MLMRNERLAKLRTIFDHSSHTLSLAREGREVARVARKVVSIINLDSLAALADVVRAPVDPLRFRANVYVAGWPVWSELDSAQRTMRLTTLSRVQGSDRQNLAEKLNH